MADVCLRCKECSQKLKTYPALLKHFELRHAGKPVPKQSAFFEEDKEVKLITPRAIKSTAAKNDYAWLLGLVKRLNGVHHHPNKG